MVRQGIVRQDGLNVGVHMCLRRNYGVVKEPGDIRKSSSADSTAQPGCSQFGVSSEEMFNLHLHSTTDWDCVKKENKITRGRL